MGILTPGSGFQTKFGNVDYRSLPTRRIWWNNATTDRQPHYKGEYGTARGFLGSNGLRRSLFGAACDFSLWRKTHAFKQSWGIPKTVHFLFPSNTADVATDTTLAASTVYTAPTTPIKIDEVLLPKGRRAFLSVKMIAYFWGQWTVNNGTTGTRITFQLGGATPYTIDRSHASSLVSGRSTSQEVETDLTAYFNDNWSPTVPGGENLMQMDAVATIAVSTASAMNVNGHCFEIIATYAIEPSVQPTTRKRTKTLRIPIQGNDAVLTNVQQEIGAAGGAPRTNQLPQLTGGGAFLKEAGIEIIQATIQTQANTADTAATDYTPQLQIDADPEIPRALIERGNWVASGMMWKDHLTYAGSYHGAAHAFNMRADLTARLDCPSAFLVVTYAYNWSTTTIVTCQKMVPPREDASLAMASWSTNFDRQGLTFEFDIVEGAPTIKQSAIVCIMSGYVNSATLPAKIGTGAERIWTFINNVGEHFIVHRFDGDQEIVEGINVINYTWRFNVAQNRVVVHSAFALVLYDVTLPAGVDPDQVSRPVMFNQRQTENNEGFSSASISTDSSTDLRPPMLGDFYSVDGILMEQMEFTSPANVAANKMFLETVNGDFNSSGTGYNGPAKSLTFTGGGTPICSWHFRLGLTEYFSRRSGRPNVRKVLETSRRQNLYIVLAGNTLSSWHWWISVHNCRFDVGGYVSLDGIDAPAGATIKLWAYDANGDAELIDTTVVGFEGTWLSKVHDRHRTYFATYSYQGLFGKSDDYSPPSGSMDIVVRNTPPNPSDVEITSFPATTTTSTSASFSFAALDATEYSVDGGAYAPAASPINLVGLSVAAHSITIRSVAVPTSKQSFDWEVVSGGGGGPIAAPTISNVTPIEGFTPGAPGEFSMTFSVARLTPIEFDIEDIHEGADITISVHYADRLETYTALRSGESGVFEWPFDVQADNEIGPITPEPVHVRLLPRGGWPPTTVSITVAAAKKATGLTS